MNKSGLPPMRLWQSLLFAIAAGVLGWGAA